MPVSFCNHGHIDLATITTMGVSVKEGESPIGFFGTGMKYAIATLLRTGHTIELNTGGRRIPIAVVPTLIRGQSFDVVHVDGAPAGFTTALGKNWEAWQAYRELASNARDEGEYQVMSHMGYIRPEKNWDTCWTVVGEGIEGAHALRDTIFCNSAVLAALDGVEIRARSSKFLFYRGVRAMVLPEESRFTWNITEEMTLTEDRTIAYSWVVSRVVTDALVTIQDAAILEQVLAAPTGWERRIDFDYCSNMAASERPEGAVFQAFMERHGTNMRVNETAHRVWRKHRKPEPPKAAELTDNEYDTVRRAESICRSIVPEFQLEFVIVSGLGNGILGCIRDGEVLISRDTIDMGVNMVAGTLLEEWCHKEKGLLDETRDFQNWLINKCIALALR